MHDRFKPLRPEHTGFASGISGTNDWLNASLRDATKRVDAEIDGVHAEVTYVESQWIPVGDGWAVQSAILRYRTIFVTEEGFVAFWRRTQSDRSDEPWALYQQAFVRGDDPANRLDRADAMLEFKNHLIAVLPAL
jgi:hypothetical protein